jgi:hypothetical protein
MYRNGSKHIENAGPEAGRNSDERMKQRRNGGCKNSGADGAWVEAKGPKNGRRVMEVRRRAEWEKLGPEAQDTNIFDMVCGQ